MTSGDVLEPDTPESLGILDLDGDRDDRLGLGLAPLTAALHPADVPLVNLDVTRQPFAARTDHDHAIAVEHRPRGLVGAEPERSLNPQCRDAVLLTGHLSRGREPQPKRGTGAMKDRACSHRRLAPADSALPAPVAKAPPVPTRAARTAHPVGPAQPLKVVEARELVRKPRQQLRVRAWIVSAGHRHRPSLPD